MSSDSALLIKTSADFGVGRSTESVVAKLRTISVSESAKARDEFSTAGYPVSETPLQDLINAYPRASQQLSTLRDGRYAYAQDWNVLADYAKTIINALVNQFNELYARGVTHYIDLYDRVLECHRILSTYKYLKTGDVITPEHTNTLIDVARCLNLSIILLLRKAITKRSDTDVATGPYDTYCLRGMADVAIGLEQITKLREVDCEIVLVDTDDWATASSYVTDGTIIFVNYGTTAMTPETVRTIVNTRNAVFAILIDTQPRWYVDVGAFYDVFYINRYPMRVICATDCFYIYDFDFSRRVGLYGCGPGYCGIHNYLWAYDDCSVSVYNKVSFAVTWSHWGYPWLDYAYARYGAGGIIELPYDGTWASVDDLNIIIGKIAYTLLGEPLSCHIVADGNKFRRVVWMASYKEGASPYRRCTSTAQCLRDLASRVGCRFIDLRTS